MARIVLYKPVVRRTARNKGREEVRTLTGKVLDAARYLAPRGSHKHGSGRIQAGPRLADSFGRRFSETPFRVTGEVYNTREYSSTVFNGSQPHEIRPRRKRVLMFEWPRGELSPRLRKHMWRGKFFFEKVHHPGNKHPTRSLQTPLAMYGRRQNFIVRNVPVGRSRLP